MKLRFLFLLCALQGWLHPIFAADSADTNDSASSIVIGNKSTEYAASSGNGRLSLMCDGSGMIDTTCFIRLGSSENVPPVRFVAQITRYAYLLRAGVEKASAPEQSRLSVSDVALIRELDFDQCHPAAESNGLSGDLLQMCMLPDSSKAVLFMRGLCDRCEFEPIILEKQDRHVP